MSADVVNTFYPPTAFDEIIAAAVAALTATPALAGGRVFAEVDADPLPEDQEQQIIVSIDGSDSQEIVIGQLQWTSLLRIDAQRRNNGRQRNPQTAGMAGPAHVLLNQALERLMADPTLGGVVQHLHTPRIRTARDNADTRLGCAYLVLTAQHVTAFNTLTRPA